MLIQLINFIAQISYNCTLVDRQVIVQSIELMHSFVLN